MIQETKNQIIQIGSLAVKKKVTATNDWKKYKHKSISEVLFLRKQPELSYKEIMLLIDKEKISKVEFIYLLILWELFEIIKFDIYVSQVKFSDYHIYNRWYVFYTHMINKIEKKLETI